jgi:hypothetical protein
LAIAVLEHVSRGIGLPQNQPGLGITMAWSYRGARKKPAFTAANGMPPTGSRVGSNRSRVQPTGPRPFSASTRCVRHDVIALRRPVAPPSASGESLLPGRSLRCGRTRSRHVSSVFARRRQRRLGDLPRFGYARLALGVRGRGVGTGRFRGRSRGIGLGRGNRFRFLRRLGLRSRIFRNSGFGHHGSSLLLRTVYRRLRTVPGANGMPGLSVARGAGVPGTRHRLALRAVR